jgi:bifunctional non-homologous end joining protein LigD
VTVVDVENRQVTLTNLDKVLWPDNKFTKGDLIRYYVDVAPVLLPHLESRPVTLRRFPDGIHGPSWHQNQCRGEPDWLRVHEHRGRQGRPLRFCVIDDLAALVWVANQAAVEVHPFLWRIDAPRQPTQIVFDLDPGPPAGLLETARVALLLRRLLGDLGLEPYVKASGSLGLHVQVPIPCAVNTKETARAIGRVLASEHPQVVTADARRAARAGKVYVDWLQNDPSRQLVAPYSLRGVPGPRVAAPLAWAEVEEALEMDCAERLVVGPDEARRRIADAGDLFARLR